MKKLLTVLLTALALSANVQAEQKEINIDGEWYIAPYFGEFGAATKDDDGNYHVVIDEEYKKEWVYYTDGTVVMEHLLDEEISKNTLHSIQISDDTFFVYNIYPEQPDVFVGYVFLKSDKDYMCYSVRIPEDPDPVLFNDGNIFEYAVSLDDATSEESEGMHYMITGDTLYLMYGNEYIAGKLTQFGDDILMYETDNSEEESGGLIHEEMQLLVRASLLDQPEASQDSFSENPNEK